MKKFFSVILVLALCVTMAVPVFASGNQFSSGLVQLDDGTEVEFETMIDKMSWVALSTSGAQVVEIVLLKPNTSVTVSSTLTADVHTFNPNAEYYDKDLEMYDYAFTKDGTVRVATGKVEKIFENLDVENSFVKLGTAEDHPILLAYYDVPYEWIENPFTDVSPDDLFYSPVMWALYNNVTTGTSATTFSPNGTCTRGQVVTFLWRAMGCPEPLSIKSPFTDVKSTDYFYKPVLWAIEEGITTGTSATTFSPSDTCQYSHVLTFLWRALGTPMPMLTGTSNPFGSAYYSEAFEFAYEYGLIPEDINAYAPCPRAEIVEFLYWVLPY